MADSIPAALRQADVNIWKCATKAAQLQNVKPIMAYWCEYWVVNQILAKQLHTVDEEILAYTTALMDRLEQTKAEYANEDAIMDDTAGQAYVEQFAQETLDRAERVVKANRVTQQTATTFDAAATFFHVVNVWGPADQETQQKIKYAKWNAARIVKAIKEGKDPNESNPTQEEHPQPALDQNDPAVQNLIGGPSTLIPRPATVEEVPDVDLRRDAAGVSPPQSPVSGGPSPASEGELRLPGVPNNLHQPAEPEYFGSASHDPSNSEATPDLPGPPTGWAPSQRSPETSPPPTAWSQPPINPPSASAWPHQQPSAPSTIPPTFATNLPSTAAVASPPVSPPTDSYYVNMAPTAHGARPTAPSIPPAASYAPVQAGSFAVDEAAIVGAQKHAKWAISALNFEDVPTAVKELRRALELLGAT
ncbi:Vacuolar protein sorting-associated protein VTA1 [Madurella fahalii]|uniref:Vacuolar protein sorting-associated protein VTA1 n=1 Tax=Madurella fahalii TaxID=1157608 RepID=A0ABQ0FYS7_9PEZI